MVGERIRASQPIGRWPARVALTAATTVMRPRPAGRSWSYRRFVVLAHQRSGSTWVVATLQAHPRVVCFSEAFNPGEAQLYVPGLPSTSTTLRWLRERAPVTFLERVVFAGYAAEIGAVGFKLMATQLDQAGSRPVVASLLDDPSVTILRVIRENKLAAALSLHHAQSTGIWHLSRSSSDPDSPPTRLDPVLCEEMMAGFAAQDERLDVRLVGRAHHTIRYEDLVASPRTRFDELQQILGVEPRDIPVPSRRQQTRPLRDAVDNFDELTDHFAGSRWESYFTP